uniref:Putative C3a receptor n=1 Tax=Ciona intestinalis TaxID=7719 RepID=Q14SS9_CIOIN|nr:putative C3a receptor [Ciona intestinalis]CAI84650.1 putative C3a receptor [Ciona intestinalis]|eukprot:NP_001072020.1 putative C3a receptor [Ciona intestinalis]
MALAQDVVIIFLCICGIGLNTAMLGLFCVKKQVRGSIYTTYMIQIAATDLIVCLVWLIMTSLFLHELPTEPTLQANAEPPPTSSLTLYRFIYAVYNFHYYINIFLLATMSVERCVAVWKSLRCQRYQFNRKFIYGVSALMWLIAFSCALPSFIRLDLVTDNINITRPANMKVAETHMYMKCYEPLKHASDNNLTYVMDYDGISAVDCYDIMQEDYLSLIDEIDTGMMDPMYEEYQELYTDDIYGDTGNITMLPELMQFVYQVTLPNGDNMTVVDHQIYFSLFHGIISHIHNKSKKEPLGGICDPRLNKDAKIYNIIVNLIIGFFIPFLAILISYVSIAHMIRVRALDRMENDCDVIESESTLGRRMSDFLRQFVSGGGPVKNVGESTPPYNKGSSPLLRRSLRKKARDRGTGLEGSEVKSSRDDVVKPPVVRREEKPVVRDAGVDRRPRLSSFSHPTHSRRTSGGSASSAESFQTDQTSLHAATPSPGVRLSAPIFVHDKTPVQRASSTETPTHPRSPPTRRWSSETLRSPHEASPPVLDETEPLYDRVDDVTMAKPTSPPSGDSTQELFHGSYARLYSQKPDARPRYQRQASTTSNYRSRAYSATSRAGGGGGTLRKTIVHKNAERHLRISRTALTYVCVFAVCWLPQRIVAVVYVVEGMVGLGGHACHAVFTATRILSFLSVLLNPIVYAMTQREIRHLLRRKLAGMCKCIHPGRESNPDPQNRDVNVSFANARRDFSVVADHNITSDEIFMKRERHARNKERWSRLMHRLGGKNLRLSLTGSGFTSPGEKQSDGTIDEDEEKGQSSKGQSSSTSFKLIGGWEDCQQMIDMAEVNKGQTTNEETIL